MRALGTVGSVGFAFVIAVMLGWWLGSIVDRWLGTSHWFTFVFFILGVIAGGLNVHRAMLAIGNSGGSRRDDRRA